MPKITLLRCTPVGTHGRSNSTHEYLMGLSPPRDSQLPHTATVAQILRNGDKTISTHLPKTRACTSCVPSYVFTVSRFTRCRITWYSSEMPLPPSISLLRKERRRAEAAAAGFSWGTTACDGNRGRVKLRNFRVVLPGNMNHEDGAPSCR